MSIDPEAWRLAIPLSLALVALVLAPYNGPRRLWSRIVSAELARWERYGAGDWRSDPARARLVEAALFGLLFAALALGTALSLAAGRPW